MANRIFGHRCICGNVIQLEKNESGSIIIDVHGEHRMEILSPVQRQQPFITRFKPSFRTIVCDGPKIRTIGPHILTFKCGKNIRVSTFKEVIL